MLRIKWFIVKTKNSYSMDNSRALPMLKLSLKGFDLVTRLVDGIESSESPFMDMVRVVATVEGKLVDDLLLELSNYMEVVAVFDAVIAALNSWLEGDHVGNEFDTEFVIDGVRYSMSFAELLTPNRVDLVKAVEREIKSDLESGKLNAMLIAKSLACYCYSEGEIDLVLEANRLDDDLYVKETKERFVLEWKKRSELFYDKLSFRQAMLLRSFFLQNGQR